MSGAEGLPDGEKSVPSLDAIPEALRAARRWVLWRLEARGDDGKPTKVPYSVHDPTKPCDVTDPESWATYEEVADAWAYVDMSGIGIRLGDGLAVADLDASRDPDTGEVAAWADRLAWKLTSYTEVSPSGTGLHVVAGGAPDHLPSRSIPMEGPQLNGKRPAVEIKTTGYVTITGHTLGAYPTELRDAPDAWAQIAERLRQHDSEARSRPAGRKPTGATEIPEDLRTVLLDDSTAAGRLWAGEKDDGDTSCSGMDASLAATLGAMGCADEAIEAALRSYPHGQVSETADDRQIGRLLGIAAKAREDRDVVSLDDFYAFMPQHRYLYVPCREMWPASSVNGRIPPIPVGDGDFISASRWLDRHRPVEQMTWAPGLPMLIEDRLIAEGGWIDHPGVSVFNLYREPRIEGGDPAEAGPWLDHAERLFDDPDVTDHVLSWLAHRVLRPGEKINHALLLGGPQGIGKDTLLEPVKYAVGPWNFRDITPTQLLGRFNDFVKSVVLRISEARDLGDLDRYAFYEHLKLYTAAPPDVIRVDEKHIREYAVPNVCGVIITTNHKTAGPYLPADDRRHFVAWSERTPDDFDPAYWNRLWSWYADGGIAHVAAYLFEHHDLDALGFDPKAPPPKTPAFWDIVDAGRAPEDAELADALDRLDNPRAVTIARVADKADSDFADWLRDRRNARQVPHRFEEVGYVSVRNPAAKDGRWKIGGRRQVVYAHHDLPRRDQLAAAQGLVEEAR